MSSFRTSAKAHLHPLVLFVTALFIFSNSSNAWWNTEWSARRMFTVDTSSAGVAINEPIGAVAVLVRLHDGNFQFAAGKEDGSDLRFVAADDKTLLVHHIERYDAILNEAFVWVKLPDLKSNAQTSFWLYHGNFGDKAARVDDSKATYDPDTVLVYHFSENGTAPFDFSPGGNKAEKAGTPAATAIIGGGLRFTGQNAVTIPASASLEWKEGAESTWSAWIKPSAFHVTAVLFSRHEGSNAFVIGESNGVPFVEVTNSGATQRSPDGKPLLVNAWRHLAVVSQSGSITLYLDGEIYSVLNASLPALNGAMALGKDDLNAQAAGFAGELDELQIARTARTAGYLKFAAISQSGSENAGKILAAGKEEAGANGGGGELMEHLSLFSEISKSLTFDGWVVIGLCSILAIIGWSVALSKFFYLNRIQKASSAFREQWKLLSSDLTALDHSDDQAIKSMGGNASANAQELMRESPLFHIYHIGSQEISHRMANAKNGFKGLSERSVQAIRVTLDGGLFREVQRLNRNIVFLTIGIAGGPYLGLLGTVIGVMITFAVIAKSGEVEINSIAPGIAGALLATVAGLAVAIPALFAYSYLSARIKDSVGEMHNFIEEFLAKIAEFYSSSSAE